MKAKAIWRTIIVFAVILLSVGIMSFIVIGTGDANNVADAVAAQAVASADSSDVSNSKQEIFDVSGVTPTDYKKDENDPYGISKDSVVSSVPYHEVTMFYAQKDKQLSDGARYDYIDKIDYSYAQSGRRDGLLSAGATGARTVSYVDGVAFNGGRGTKDYAAYIGVKKKDNNDGAYLVMWVVDLFENKYVCEPVTLCDMNWIMDVNQFCYTHYIDITAGDFNGDGKDELAVLSNGDTWQGILIFGDPVNSTQYARDFDILSFVDKSTITEDALAGKPTVSLATGDTDGDEKDELIVAVNPHWAGDVKLPATYTTHLAVVKLPELTRTSAIHKVQLLQELGEKDSKKQYNVLLNASVACGDTDGDGEDEIIVVGNKSKNYAEAWTKNGSPKASFKMEIDNSKYTISVVDRAKSGYAFVGMFDVSTSSLMKQGFYDEGFNTTPVSVACVRMNGADASAFVFVSGSIYDLSEGSPKCVYTHSLMEKSRDKGSNVYCESVAVGNFTEDKAGRESVCFTVCTKYRGAQSYSYQICCIYATYKDSKTEDNIVTYGNAEDYKDNGGSCYKNYFINEQGGYIADSGKYGNFVCLVSADVDHDGVRLKYIGTDYAYRDPQPVAVLQASPYFSEISASGAGSTGISISTSNTSGNSGSNNIDVQIGGNISFKNGLDIGPIKIGGKFKVGITGSYKYSHSWTSSHSYSYKTSFKATTTDTVVLQRTPIVMYKYNVWDADEEKWSDGVMFTCYDLKPRYFQISVDEYNEFVEEYNALIQQKKDKGKLKDKKGKEIDAVTLYPVDRKVLPDAAGNPYLYHHVKGKEYTIPKDETFALGYNGGSMSSSYTETESEGKSDSHSMGGSVAMDYGFEASALGNGAEIGISFKAGYTRSWGSSSSSSTSTSVDVSVANITPSKLSGKSEEYIKMFGFSWQMQMASVCLAQSEKQKVNVYFVGYIVYDVKSPAGVPKNTNAQFDYATGDVIVSWTPSSQNHNSKDPVIKYEIYMGELNKGYTKIAEVAGDKTSYSYPYAQYKDLTKGKMYTFYVGCVYQVAGDESKTYSCVNTNGSSIIAGSIPQKPGPGEYAEPGSAPAEAYWIKIGNTTTAEHVVPVAIEWISAMATEGVTAYFMLVEDVEIDYCLRILPGKSVYLFLNGHTLTYTGGESDGTAEKLKGFISIGNGATLTVSDHGAGAINAGRMPAFYNRGELDIIGGSYNSDKSAVVSRTPVGDAGNEMEVDKGATPQATIYAGVFTGGETVVDSGAGTALTVHGGMFALSGFGNGRAGIESAGAFSFGYGDFSNTSVNIALKGDSYIDIVSGAYDLSAVTVCRQDEAGALVGGPIVKTIKGGSIGEEQKNWYSDNFTVSYAGYGVYLEKEKDAGGALTGNYFISLCYHEYDYDKIVKEPTCEDAGVREYHCKHCGNIWTEELAAYGHDYGKLIPEVPATTENYGIIAHYKCSRCEKCFDENMREVQILYIGKTGATGEAGRGVVSISKSGASSEGDIYTILYTDGTTEQLIVPKGEKGETGETGRGIASMEKVEESEMGDLYVITFTDGSTKNIVIPKGAEGLGIKDIVKTGETEQGDTYRITYTDGTYKTIVMPKGSAGESGKGIANIEKTGETEYDVIYTVTYTDGTTSEMSVPKGQAGRGIVSFEKAEETAFGDLYRITYTDGTTENLIVPKGEAGNGIASIEKFEETSTEVVYLIYYTDGTTKKLPIPKGESGKGIVSIDKVKDTDIGSVYKISYTDGTSMEFTVPKGDAGRGIVSFEKAEESAVGDLYIVTYTDGTKQNIVIPKGSAGKGIANIEKKEETAESVVYTIIYTDGTSKEITLPKGASGRGIASMEKVGENDIGTVYCITFTDGTTMEITIPKGEPGKSVINMEKVSETSETEVYRVTYSDGSTVLVSVPKSSPSPEPEATAGLSGGEKTAIAVSSVGGAFGVGGVVLSILSYVRRKRSLF